MRTFDNNWRHRFGETKITDDETDRQYILVAGLCDDYEKSEINNSDTIYIRLYNDEDNLLIGTWINYIKQCHHLSINIQEKIIKFAARMEQMRSFV
jgi:hypothetical protein